MPFKPGRLVYATRTLPGVEAGKAYEFLGCMNEGKRSIRDPHDMLVIEIDEEEFNRSFTPKGQSKIKVESVLSVVAATRPKISRNIRYKIPVANRVQRVMRAKGNPALAAMGKKVESVLARVRTRITERSL